MKNEDAIKWLIKPTVTSTEVLPTKAKELEAYNMAIEALQIDPIRCRECKYQDECEEMVLFEVNDEEVMGHRLHWCSYAERREP